MNHPFKIVLKAMPFVLHFVFISAAIILVSVLAAMYFAITQPQTFLDYIGSNRPGTSDGFAYFFAALGIPILVILAKGAYPAIKLIYMRSTQLPYTLWASITLSTDIDSTPNKVLKVHDVFQIQAYDDPVLTVRFEFADGLNGDVNPGVSTPLMLGMVDHPSTDYSSLQPATPFKVIVQGRMVGRGRIIGATN